MSGSNNVSTATSDGMAERSLALHLCLTIFGGWVLSLFSFRAVQFVYKKFKVHIVEDCFAGLAFVSFAALALVAHFADMYHTNLYRDDDAASILSNPIDIKNRILGSQLRIAMEQLMAFTTLFAKLSSFSCLGRQFTTTVMPVFRASVTKNINMGLLLFILTFAIVEIPFFSQCKPFSNYWMMPATSEECTERFESSSYDVCFSIMFTGHLVIMAYLVVSRTSALLSPARERWIMAGYLLTGLTLTCTVINKYIYLQNPYDNDYYCWYIVEAGLLMLVSNGIQMWPIIELLGLGV